MKTVDDWRDYAILATANGMKLERWKDTVLLRPDPQVIWKGEDLSSRKGINAVYRRSDKGGGGWETRESFPPEWNVMREIIGRARSGGREQVKVLNLFAYTGGASVACAKAGAFVTHVDASKGMVERAGENARLSGIDSGIRYIIDDCMKFVAREIKRGNRYDAVIMDPPSYGRGPNGEMWKIEDNLFEFVEKCALLLTDKPLFFLITSYTTGLQPTVIENLLKLCLKNFDGEFESYEVGLPTDEKIILPCGCSGLFTGR